MDVIDKLNQLDIKRICLIKPSALGDVVQTLPILPAIKNRFPDAHISWVINSGLEPLIEDHPHLDEAIVYHRRGNWHQQRALFQKLRSSKFDLVFDLQGLFRTGLMTWATGAKLKIGLETARECSQLFCHSLIPDTSKHVPAWLRYWRVAQLLGQGEMDATTIIPVPKQTRQKILQQLAPLGELVIGVQPGARWETKRWPVDKYAHVLKRMMSAYNASVVILGSKDEQNLAEQLTELIKPAAHSAKILNLCGRTSLKELTSILSEIDLLLTNDTGPMHLAAGLGTKVVSVFLCTSGVRSGPIGKGHQVVSTNVPCAASYHKTCPQRGNKHHQCFQELDSARVEYALSKSLATLPRKRRIA
jgi:lipopolysaccharide heptosyltransferase II